jgi:hypothetical protein
MKKMIIWTVAVLFVFSTSLVFAQSAQKETVGGSSETKSGAPGGVAAPAKSREDVKKEKAAKKKKVKKEEGAKKEEAAKKGPETVGGSSETKSGAPAGVPAPTKSTSGK